MDVHAEVGDEIVVDLMEMGRSPRRGEVLEVIGEGDLAHYRVRWDDGHESTFFPSTSTHVVHTKRQRPNTG
ncbi:MAG: DUF1918 domain-containing protein [Actinobacteria bacterium]|nr:DUF1918 domain-containing protein [Actinomycetota bacterium]